MEKLGIDQKFVRTEQNRPLAEVAGSYTYFAENDVLLAKITPCFENGKLGIVNRLTNGVGFGSSEYIVFRPNSDLNREWLYYFLSRQDFRDEGAKQMCGAVGHKRVSAEFIANCLIPVPPLPEQQRIVRTLDEAFASIATAKVNAEKNLQNARELFDSCIASLFPNQQGVFNQDRPLSAFCNLIVDCEHSTAPVREEGIPLIRTPNVGKGTLLLDGVYKVSNETYVKWSRRAEPKPGDLILAREAPAGNVAVIPPDLKVCLGQRTVLIRPKPEVFDSFYLAMFLLRSDTQQRLLAHSRGATVQHVNMKDIRALTIGRVPPIEVQRDISSMISALSVQNDRMCTNIQQKGIHLDMLKQSMLRKAFAGALG